MLEITRTKKTNVNSETKTAALFIYKEKQSTQKK